MRRLARCPACDGTVLLAPVTDEASAAWACPTCGAEFSLAEIDASLVEVPEAQPAGGATTSPSAEAGAVALVSAGPAPAADAESLSLMPAETEAPAIDQPAPPLVQPPLLPPPLPDEQPALDVAAGQPSVESAEPGSSWLPAPAEHADASQAAEALDHGEFPIVPQQGATEAPEQPLAPAVTFDFDQDSGTPSARRLSAQPGRAGLLANLVGIVGGGIVGLALGYIILVWLRGPQGDFLQLRHKLPWLFPASIQLDWHTGAAGTKTDFVASLAPPQRITSSGPGAVAPYPPQT